MKKEFLLYAAVSAVALAVDVAILYLATARFAMPSYIAAALAYAIGLAVHYVLSVRYVFTHRRMASQRRTEVMVYALTGLVGILLSAGIVHVGDLLDQVLAVSKLVAIAVSFIAVFMIRKITLFSTDKNSAKEAA
jgi:putative flippase GtrA